MPEHRLPAKQNVVRSAKVATLASQAASYGVRIGVATVDMAGVRQRKRRMVDALSIWSSFWAKDPVPRDVVPRQQ